MSVSPDTDQILQNAVKDGSIAIQDWPRVLPDILQRLSDIAHNEFPLPRPPTSNHFPNSQPSDVDSTPPPPHLSDDDSALTPPPGGSQDVATVVRNDAMLSEVFQLLQNSLQTLERDFAHQPPYTLQRLAELVLYPRTHYRFLPAYLRALDRVVSVSSATSDFPLASGTVNGNNSSFLTNGDLAHPNDTQELGSDESLGGALLTPIPWLRTTMAPDGEFRSERMDTIVGPNGTGSIETVSVTVNGVSSTNGSKSVSPTLSEQSDASTNSSESMSTDAQLREQGGVTQGELLRQEQEAGVIPVAQSRRMDDAEDLPHARGPEMIGMEDTGHIQGGDHDMAAAVGRARSPQPPEKEPDANSNMLVEDEK